MNQPSDANPSPPLGRVVVRCLGAAMVGPFVLGLILAGPSSLAVQAPFGVCSLIGCGAGTVAGYLSAHPRHGFPWRVALLVAGLTSAASSLRTFGEFLP